MHLCVHACTRVVHACMHCCLSTPHRTTPHPPLAALQVHVLRYDPDQGALACTHSAQHAAGEVWDIATSCQAEDLLLTAWAQGGRQRVARLYALQASASHRGGAEQQWPGHEHTTHYS